MSFLYNPVYYSAVSLYIQILLSWFCTRNFNSDTFMPNTRYVLLFMSSLTILSPSLSSLPPLSLSLSPSLLPQPTIDHRFDSYYNYCELFNLILSTFQPPAQYTLLS